jgi:hypothetical protein
MFNYTDQVVGRAVRGTRPEPTLVGQEVSPALGQSNDFCVPQSIYLRVKTKPRLIS